MSFLNFFKNNPESEIKKYSNLYHKLEKEFPELDENELILSSCISGLYARVAYVDFDLDDLELKKIEELISNWNFGNNLSSSTLAKMSIDHIKEMAGLENHLYVYPLKNKLNAEDKFNVLKSLFLVAAADGSVDSIESEEIRLITKGLELSNQHFIAARAEVADFLKALK